MEISDFIKSLNTYEKEKSKSFNFALNNLVNELDPSKNIDEFGNTVQKNKTSDIFYKEKVLNNSKESVRKDLSHLLNTLPKSTGNKYEQKLDYNIGIISDSDVYNIFKDTAKFNYVSYKKFENKVSVDLMIITTLSEGIDGSWRDLLSNQSQSRKKLLIYIEELKANNIPIIFLADESVHNIKNYFDIIQQCSVVYTNNNKNIDMIKELTQNNNVYLMENLINPILSNPIGIDDESLDKNSARIVYSDYWNANSTEKQIEAKRMIDSVMKSDAELNVFDEKLHSDNIRNQFPSEYISNIYEPFKERNLFKMYKWSLIVNNDKYNNTIFSKSIFESLAMGNVVLSNYNNRINNLIPSVKLVHEFNDINQLLSIDETQYKNLRAKNIRYVMKNHNVFSAVRIMLDHTGIKPIDEQPKILVVLNQDTESNMESFSQQMYDNKDYITEDRLNETDLSRFDYITHFDDKYVYEEYYLDDLLTGFKYTDSDYITKNLSNTSHSYVNGVMDKALSLVGMDTYKDISSNEEKSFSGYNLDDAELILKEEQVVNVKSESKELSIIVPIHNNGHYLEEKCFASLERSSSFNKMEIIFINDGSNDDMTKRVINRIIRRNPDILYYEYAEGSGSASRPRNKGIELATTEYISYLDPDNEALGDGYHYLMEAARNEDVDAVVGNIITEHSNKRDAGKYTAALKKVNDRKVYVENPRQLLIDSGMRVQSIQAMIIKKSIIKNKKIEMIEGAAGQDTMFFQEVVLNCKSMVAVDKYIHVYYADVSGSVTNTLSKKFFDKYYILELKRIPFLEKYKILDVYLNEIFNYYLRTWYFKKLDLVAESERILAVDRLLQILSLYDKYKNYLEKDNREKMNELFVENMKYGNFKVSTKLKEEEIFNEKIEKKPDLKLTFNNFKGFKEKISSQYECNAVITINLLNESELKEFELMNFSTMENKNLEIIIDEEIFKKIDKSFWISSFYIKLIRNTKSNMIIQMFRMNRLNPMIEKNNANIIDKFINQKIKNNDGLDLHSAHEAINLSEVLLDEINKNKLTKKNLQKIIEQL